MLPSRRDLGAVRVRLTEWLGAQVGAGPAVGELSSPTTTGLSSETLLFDATWKGGSGRYVLRMAPEEDGFPVFPEYDLTRQHRTMEVVGRCTDVPVPRVVWTEDDDSVLGSPFFVMERIDGIAPPDLMPYVYGSWVTAATADERARIEDGIATVQAKLHRIEPSELGFLDRPAFGPTGVEQLLSYEHWYYDWAREGVEYPLIEAAFSWLERDIPTNPNVSLIWGDARIGNILWDCFAPVAVLDWEMAALGPAEVDVAWAVFMHRFFQHSAETHGVPGLPDFLLPDTVRERYEAAGGRRLGDLSWYEMFAALRLATVSIRTSGREVALGNRPAPDDPDDLLMHRDLLALMLDGR